MKFCRLSCDSFDIEFFLSLFLINRAGMLLHNKRIYIYAYNKKVKIIEEIRDSSDFIID